MGITYCSKFDCAYTSCTRNQCHAPKDDSISIADLCDGWCYMPAEHEPFNKRKELLAAICRGTQKTNYKCSEVCRAMCGNDGTCAYCSIIADFVEEAIGRKFQEVFSR